MNRLFVLGLLLAILLPIQAQQLRRKAMLGIQPQPIDLASAEVIGLPAGKTGILLNQVFPQGTAQEIGLQEKDIVLSINEQEMVDLPALLAVLSELRAGDQIIVKAFRDSQIQTFKGKVQGRPLAEGTQYEEVPFMGGHLRAYVQKPTGEGPFPAIYFIQGYPCQDVELLNPIHPYKQMIDGLVEQGFAVFRIEKPGMGDSEGTPACMEIDFTTELNGFRAGYQHLMNFGDIDQNQVYIFGHSLGGLVAPLLAQEYQPAGVMVYGIVLKNWEDYLIDMIRDQSPLFGRDYAEVEQDLMDIHPVMNALFHDGKSPAVIAENPQHKALLERHLEYQSGDIYLNRHYTFWNDLSQYNITEAWKNTKGRVLAMYGEADIQALSTEGAENIAQVVNHYHPGQATFQLIPETDHSFIKVGNKVQGWEIQTSGQYGQYVQQHFNTEVVDLVVDWIGAQHP